MRIAFFYQYFGTPKGSWSTRVYEMAKRWVESGHQVTVITAPYDKSDLKVNNFISKLTIEGINVIVINSGDSNRFSKGKRVFRAFQFSLVSIWYALILKYDVCVASSGPITIGLPMIMAKKIRNKPTIFEVRDLWPAGGIEMGLITKPWQKRLALWFERVCYKSANLIVTASVGQKSHIEKRFTKLRIDVIPNASDIELFGTKANGMLPAWVRGKILFTHIGSLGLIHNTQYWVEVAKELAIIDSKQTVVFVFIGDGVDRESLITQKEKLKLNNIHFLGLKPKSELPLWIQHSRATLFATLNNEVQNACSPNKIFDSFAGSTPIIQTSTGWIGDLVAKENCGINVPLNSPREAAKKILYLAENKEIAAELGKNALRLAKNEFNRDILADKYAELMKSLIIHE